MMSRFNFGVCSHPILPLRGGFHLWTRSRHEKPHEAAASLNDRIPALEQIRLNRSQLRRLAENILAALYLYCVFKPDDVNHSAVFITNVDTVTQIDPARFGNTGLDHGPGFAECMSFRSHEVGQFNTLIVDDVHVVVKVEEIARHARQTVPTPLGCQS